MRSIDSLSARRAAWLLVIAYVAPTATATAGADGLLYEKTGRHPAADFGHALAGIGDVDGDGFDDFVVGAPGNGRAGEAAGSAYVLSGRRGKTIYRFDGSAPGERLGYSVAAAGDVDGDRWPDFVISAPALGSGRVDVYSGRDGSVLHRLRGEVDGGLFGGFVDGIEDVDGDGRDDIVVSSPVARWVEVFSGAGGTPLYRIEGFRAVANIVRLEARGVGDIDGDGWSDLLVGEPLGANNRGRVHLYSGPTGEKIRTWEGTKRRSAWFGYAVDGLDDVDGDGLPDLLVGYANRIKSGFITGEAQVLSGESGRLVKRHRGPKQSASFGRAVGAAGDTDGDGVGDYLVGAPYYHGNRGRATLISGRTGKVLRQIFGERRWRLGYTVAGSIDLDGDGFSDVVIATPARDDHRGAIRAYSGRELTRSE